MSGKKGFTLIELLVVIIIVGVLAAVAIPMMRGNVMRAKASEAVAALGAIRSQMRAHRAEHGVYNTNMPVVPFDVVGNVPGFSAGDLNGAYFVDGDYTIILVNPGGFIARATGTVVGGSRGESMNGVVLMLDQNGAMYESYP